MLGFGRNGKYYRECMDVLVQQVRINKTAAAKFIKHYKKYIDVPFKRGESPVNAVIQLCFVIIKNYENIDIPDHTFIAGEVAKCVIYSHPESAAATQFIDLGIKINKELDNDPLMQDIESALQIENNKDEEETIIQLLNELQSQMDGMVSAFYWEKDRKKQIAILSKLSSHMLTLLEAVGPKEFDSFYNDADTMARTVLVLAAVMSGNTQLMDVFRGYNGIDFDVEMEKADTYRGYMFEKYEEAKSV